MDLSSLIKESMKSNVYDVDTDVEEMNIFEGNTKEDGDEIIEKEKIVSKKILDKKDVVSENIISLNSIKNDIDIKEKKEEIEEHQFANKLIHMKDYINTNVEKLQYTKYIDISSEELSDDGIIILKSIGDDKNKIIQLYKNMNDYNVLDKNLEYMKLCGENGFLIKYESENNYHWKLYGTKSNISVVLFLDIGDKQYPLYIEKTTKTKFTDSYVPDEVHIFNTEEYLNRLDDDSNFDIEECCIYYHPFYKKMDELTSKKLVVDKLHDILMKTYDVAHCLKIINAMLNII